MTNEQIANKIEVIKEQVEQQYQYYKSLVTNGWSKEEIFERAEVISSITEIYLFLTCGGIEELIKNKTPIGQEVILTFLSRDNILTNLKDFDYNFDDCQTHSWEDISNLISKYVETKIEQIEQNKKECENNE